jgi:hypothetical protein
MSGRGSSVPGQLREGLVGSWALECLSSPDSGHMCRSIVDTVDGGCDGSGSLRGGRGRARGSELPGGGSGPRGLQELGRQGGGPAPGGRLRGDRASLTGGEADPPPDPRRARGRDHRAPPRSSQSSASTPEPRRSPTTWACATSGSRRSRPSGGCSDDVGSSSPSRTSGLGAHG